MSVEPVFAAFLGSWMLIPESCQYEQGDAPEQGMLRIASTVEGLLTFIAEWTDAQGERHAVTLSGPSDGTKVPFAGGELADAIAVEAVSSRELNSYAYWKDKELMVAQRQLDATGQAMRITQIVRLPDGSRPCNVSVYRRLDAN